MNWEMFGAIAEMVGGAGVIASLVFESVLYMKEDDFIHDGSYIRFEQLVLAISRTKGGGQWWKYMYNVIGTDVAEHINTRIKELGDSVPPWNELLPHFKFAE